MVKHATESNLEDGRRANTATLDLPFQQLLLKSVPASMNSWDATSSSPGSNGPSSSGPLEKQKPFKNKSKHNLAVFGAKLTSTAASVGVHTAKYKQQMDLKESTKESHRESVFVDAPEFHPFDPSAIINSPIGAGSHSGAGASTSSLATTLGGSGGGKGPTVSSGSSTSGNSVGGGLKSKMFKQSKTDLKSLKIKTDLGLQAARSSLNDRSPMARGGPSKELDRIAAIGRPGNSPTVAGDFPFSHSGTSSHYHLHHPHISFRKRDSPAAVLSSSASNSTLASEGTVYSFNHPSFGHASSFASPTSNGGHSGSMHSFKTAEEGAAFLTSSWTLLNLRIQPVFKKDEALRIPVEDVNILVLLHFTAHYEQGGTGLELLTRLDELLQTGLHSSSVVPQHASLESLAESWQYFYGKTLITLEAVFLPLQLELVGNGQVFTTARRAREYWMPLIGYRSSAFHKNNALSWRRQRPNIRRRVLTVYRDVAVMPILPKITKLLTEDSSTYSSETIMQVMQCLTALSNLRADGEAQGAVDRALKILVTVTTKRVRAKPRR